MNVHQMIEWLKTLDLEMQVAIEGAVCSSNVDKNTGNFYYYTDSKAFDIHSHTDICEGLLLLGIEI